MNAIILCAGFATRMYPLTRNFPKPLLEVAGKPVINYLLEQLVSCSEIKSLHIVTNARFITHFEQWYERYHCERLFGDKAVYIHNNGCVDNESRLGAAADLMFVMKKMQGHDRLVVSGGDNIFRFSLDPLVKTFLQSKHHVITALKETDINKLQKTGVLQLEADDRVVRLDEKPQTPQSTWISPPLYFFQPRVFQILDRFLESQSNHDAPGYFIKYLCRQDTVKAVRVAYPRYDIGSLETYREADREIRENHGVLY